MKVTVAKTAGFCFGVRRALQLTEESAARTPTCTLGELIHNRQVVEQLAGQGVAAIERPEDAPAGMTVVIRSHGVPPQVTAALQRRGNPLVDAPCPFVPRLPAKHRPFWRHRPLFHRQNGRKSFFSQKKCVQI